MNRQAVARELVAAARELTAARPPMRTSAAILILRNLEEGRIDADSYESRELVNYLLSKSVRLRDAGKYLSRSADGLNDFIATDGRANAKMLKYLREALERYEREGLLGR